MLDPYAAAAKFKHEGIGRQESWSHWIKLTSLNPGMDAKDWWKIFDSVEPAFPEPKKPVVINATHFDEFMGCAVEISEDSRGVFSMRWANGMTGSYPPCDPPDWQRFTLLKP